MTKGEYRVGLTFNPGGDIKVTKIKRAAADLIDLIMEIEFNFDGLDTDEVLVTCSDIYRLKELATNAIEEGAMWAVKAATKPAWEE